MPLAPRPAAVAVIGGGISGATAVSHLVRVLPPGSTVVLFDQGRALGGRTSVRRVQADGARIAAEAAVPDAYFAWDHGCQFFRADTAEFRSTILPEWLSAKLAVEWRGRFGRMGGNVAEAEGDVGPDFFGLPAQTPVYHGVGGMHAIATGLLRAAVPRGQDAQIKVEIKVGARVASIRRIDAGEHAGRWQLLGTTGDAALHDSTEAVAAQALEEPCSHLFFDALLVTDASASFEGWHRASAGLPACASKVRDQVRQRVRVPLFTALIAFEKRVAVDLDAITFADQTLWFAARSVSKQGLHPQAPGQGGECWTLVSSPAYAVAEIERVPMQDPVTGAFRPQEDEYLQSEDGPAKTLLRAFAAALAPSLEAGKLPEVLYMTAQRWGSAMPAPVNVGGRDAHGSGPETKLVMQVPYDSAQSLALVPSEAAANTAMDDDFFKDDDIKLYYAGDFCSRRLPGVEAAALSAKHAALHMAAVLG
eukprot:Tamp_05422.p1 GENE.Tamp_05422~~Tamp_05422.p1  ORF type:complete len:477 (+),score=89.84 Tamp_05422:53-1483(+)